MCWVFYFSSVKFLIGLCFTTNDANKVDCKCCYAFLNLLANLVKRYAVTLVITHHPSKLRELS